MNLEKKFLSKSKKIFQTLALASLLTFPSCSKKDNLASPIPPSNSVSVQVNPSESNSLNLQDVEVYIPKGAVDSTATATLSIPDFDFPFNSEFSTNEIKFQIDKPTKDTIHIIMKDPNPVHPMGAVIAQNLSDSSFHLLNSRNADDYVRVLLPPTTEKNSQINLNSGIILEYNSTPSSCFQNLELEGDVASLITSDDKIAVLVHGLASDPLTFSQVGSTGKTFLQTIDSLYNGRVLLFRYPSGRRISENANSFYSILNSEIFSKNPNIKLDLLGHSMGGLVSRKLIQTHPEKVANLITLATPHNGALLANNINDYLLNGDLFDILLASCTPGFLELKVESNFINSLNNFNSNIPVNYLTFAGTKDWVVSSSSANMLDPSFPLTREKPQTLESKLISCGHLDFPKGSSEIFNTIGEFVEANPNTKIQLTTFKSFNSPDWSNDGQKIICTYHSQLSILNLNNNSMKIILYGADKRGFNPTYSYDDSEATFFMNSDTSLYIYNFNTSSLSKLSRVALDADWFKNGQKFVITSQDTSFFPFTDGIKMMDRQGNILQTLITGDHYFPKISPDETKIVFVSNNPPGVNQICSMNIDGTNKINLTSSYSDSPEWSPDGTKILFSSNRTGNRDIYLMNSDGTNVKNITNTPNIYESEPTFSPDGKWIAYIENGNIFKLNIEKYLN